MFTIKIYDKDLKELAKHQVLGTLAGARQFARKLRKYNPEVTKLDIYEGNKLIS